MPIRPYPSSQGELFGYKAKDKLPEGHECFVVDEIIEDLDLGPAARGNTMLGAPAYDCRMIAKVLCCGYLRGIRSSRRLAEECRENIGFIFLCRGAEPCHATIARFRTENAALLEEAFTGLVQRLAARGLVGNRHIIVDGTKIRANASNEKVLDRGVWEKAKADFEQWLSDSATVDEQEDALERLSSLSNCDGGRKPNAFKKLFDRCVEASEEGEKDEAKRVSMTDKEARFMRDGRTGKVGLSYNVQVAVDADSGMLVGCDVTQDCNDTDSLSRLVDAVEENCQEEVKAVDGDTGFFQSEQVRRLEEQGKDVCVADGHTKQALSNGNLDEFLQGEEFRYDAERDVFICSFGNEFVFKKVRCRKNGRKSRIYQAAKSCTECPHRLDCLGKSRNKYHTLERTVDHTWLNCYRQRFRLKEYQDRLRGRSIVERVFAHIKHNLGFRRFLLRSLAGARVEVFLVSLASVLRRVCNMLKEARRTWGTMMSPPGAEKVT